MQSAIEKERLVHRTAKIFNLPKIFIAEI